MFGSLRRAGIAIAILAMVGVVPWDAFAAVTVSGRIRFDERTYTQTGYGNLVEVDAVGVAVEVRSTTEVVLATGITDAAGGFSLSVSSLAVGMPFMVAVIAEAEHATVGPDGTTQWSAECGPYTVGANPFSIGNCVIRDATAPSMRAALSILDALRRGYLYARNVSGRSPSQVEVATPLGCTGSQGAVSCYRGLNTVWITGHDRDNGDVALHEYGHFVMDDYTVNLPLVGAPHDMCTLASTKEVAFSEGWATYFAAAAQQRSWWVGDPAFGYYLDLESGVTFQQGFVCGPPTSTSSEAKVAAVLWDARDVGSDENVDQVGDENRVFAILDQDWNLLSVNPTILDFRDRWNSDGAHGELDPVMCQQTGEFCATVAILADQAEIVEGGGTPATFTVTRTGSTKSALTVLYGVSGTATSGVDYVTPPGSVTIPVNSSSATITISPIDDVADEFTETITVTLYTTSTTAYKLGTPSSATVSIIDDDLPTVTVVATETKAYEFGSQSGRFTFTRNGPTTAALTITYNVSGTATPGSDYVALSGSVTIPVGSPSATVSVQPIDDTLIEDVETVIVTVSPSPNYQIGSPSTATITIVDDELPTVTILSVNDAGFESLSTYHPAFQIGRTGSTATALKVFYTVGGTATPGSDYVALSGSATIPIGSSAVNLPLSILDDTLVEGDETIIVTISPSATYFVGSQKSATILIMDDERPIVTIVATVATVAEASPTPGIFTVTRTGPTTAPLTVQLSVAGTALQGVAGFNFVGADYLLSPAGSLVTIPAGAASATVTVTPLPDTIAESTETVIATIVPITFNNPPYFVGSPNSATISILNSNPSTVAVVATVPSTFESGAPPGVFTVSRTAPTTGPLTITYAVTGTASPGVDYIAIPGSITIPAGATSATITVSPLADNVAEDPETVIVTLTSNGTYVIGSPSSATVTILDDSFPTVSVAASGSIATERGSKLGAFLVSRGFAAATPLTVFYSVGGTATPGVDYVALAGSATIAAGAGSVTIPVTLIADSLFERDKTIGMTLTATVAYGVGIPATATVTIVSDDFTGAALGPRVTTITATHFTELRNAIDDARTRHGVAAYAWTDNPIVARATRIQAVHVSELRLALAEAYVAAGKLAPTYAESVHPGTVINGSHLTELRSALVNLD